MPFSELTLLLGGGGGGGGEVSLQYCFTLLFTHGNCISFLKLRWEIKFGVSDLGM